jgi:hypothetical protein
MQHSRRSGSRRIALSLALALAFAPVTARAHASAASTRALQSADAQRAAGVVVAPDGRPGLGTRSVQELLKLMRSPNASDERWLAELRSLPAEARSWLGLTEGLYRARGLYALLGLQGTDSVAGLHQRYAQLARDAQAVAALDAAGARAYARMHLDTRLRARMAILDRVEGEARELEGGLGLLRAASSTYATLTAAEARALAQRVDLAAALLRAACRDLEALRELPDARGGVSDANVDAWLGATRAADPKAASAAFEASRSDALRLLLALQSSLAHPRLEERLAAQLAQREEDRAAGGLALRDTLLWRPDTEAGLEAPEPMASTKRADRRRIARARALEGLERDPFSDQLTYCAAETSRIYYGEYEAVGLYDRFLALRGIAFQDDRTWRSRTLDAQEQHALSFVQDYEARVGLQPPSAPPPVPVPGDH